ncbi:MAG: hypothetical protein IT405_00905 [Candidatus Yanofskybacteria bacterium]|nr:hypothetical protein [Candidatus Yanofskybacteria bacterium]
MKILVATLGALLLFPLAAVAQAPAELPGAGMTPESRFYFLEEWSEALQTLFTFKPENRARLNIAFAAERIAEIRAILEAKGVDAKGLDIAQARLQEHLADAAAIVTEQKTRGEDVSELARELGDEFDDAKSVLGDAFTTEKKALEASKAELEAKIRTARRAGDTATVTSLIAELTRVKAQLELLDQKEEGMDDELKDDEDALKEAEVEVEADDESDDRVSEQSTEAQKQIAEAEKKRLEVEAEMGKEGVQIPAASFATYDRLLAQAKAALSSGNTAGAITAAKQAKASLEDVKQSAEQLREQQKQESER